VHLAAAETPAPGTDGLFYTFTTGSPTATYDATGDNRTLARAAIEAGGTVYPISAL
jgi:hypothetical protein